MEEEERIIAIGDDGRIWVAHNFRPGEEIKWTEMFGEARRKVLEALNHSLEPQDENLPGQPMS